MCGRYEFSDERDIAEINSILNEIDKLYHGTADYKVGEIYPTNTVPVIVRREGAPAPQLMTWGFPKWDGKGVVINAKSETAADKKMFAKPLAAQRCAIPSTGFYEWKQNADSRKKEKLLFTPPHGDMLYMAGIYNAFQTGDAIKERFVIFTRAANASMEDVHDRMPVILYQNEIPDWLSDADFAGYLFHRDSVSLRRGYVK